MLLKISYLLIYFEIFLVSGSWICRSPRYSGMSLFYIFISQVILRTGITVCSNRRENDSMLNIFFCKTFHLGQQFFFITIISNMKLFQSFLCHLLSQRAYAYRICLIILWRNLLKRILINATCFRFGLTFPKNILHCRIQHINNHLQWLAQ